MPLPFRGFSEFSRLCLAAGGGLALALSGARGASSPELGHPIVRNIAAGEHLHHTVNQVVMQDTAGNLIVGLGGGDALLYDGATWVPINLPSASAAPSQMVRSADGLVYICGPGLFGVFNTSGKGEFTSLIDQLPAAARRVDYLRYMAVIGKAVYVSDEEKILIWRDGRFSVVPSPAEPHTYGTRLHAVGDTLYVTAIGQPLRRLVGERLEAVADDPVCRENQIIAVEPGVVAGGLILLTAEQGFFQLAGGRVSPLPVDANRWLLGKRVYRSLRLPDGAHVVIFSSVSGDGGARFDAEGRYLGPLDTTTALMTKALRTPFLDREGGVWIGTDVGVIRLEWPSTASLFDAASGLGRAGVTDLIRHEGALYAATGEGVFRLRPADLSEPPGRPAQFERVMSTAAYALAPHPSGLLALGYDTLFRWTPGGFVPAARMPPGGGILLRSAHDPQRVWAGTAAGVTPVRFTGQDWQAGAAVPGISEACRSLAEAADGSLWVTTQAGEVFRVREGRIAESFDHRAGLPEKTSRAVVTTAGGEPVFFFEASPTPWRFDPDRGRFTPDAGRRAPAAEAQAEPWVPQGAAGGVVWLAGESDLYRVTRDGADPRRLPHFAIAAAGPVGRLYVEQGTEGEVLWLGGAKGLVRLVVDQARISSVPFAAQIRKANVAAGERLDPEHRILTFDYVAPRFRYDSAVTYQTRLVGREREWSAWAAGRTRSFPHLSPGDYRFEVRARDAEGVISSPDVLAFVVVAPWWLRWWALCGYATGAVGLVAGVVRWRTRALYRRAEHLESIVAERTRQLELHSEELTAKNSELVRLHQLELDEKISARLAEEKARLEVLRYQLNPHFLFNTLASISASLPVERSVARSMVERLAEFCRLTLHRGGERDWTTLGEEMKLLGAYLEIERSRWGDLLDVELAFDDALAEERLPHFLLLPLVENALKYGRATSRERVGIRILARREDGMLAIEVANTGEWIEPTAQKSVASLGIGLDNLRERLERYYVRSYRLSILQTTGWVRVILHIAPRPVL